MAYVTDIPPNYSARFKIGDRVKENRPIYNTGKTGTVIGYRKPGIFEYGTLVIPLQIAVKFDDGSEEVLKDRHLAKV